MHFLTMMLMMCSMIHASESQEHSGTRYVILVAHNHERNQNQLAAHHTHQAPPPATQEMHDGPQAVSNQENCCILFTCLIFMCSTGCCGH